MHRVDSIDYAPRRRLPPPTGPAPPPPPPHRAPPPPPPPPAPARPAFPPPRPPVDVHPRGAFLSGNHGLSASPFPRQDRHFFIPRRCRANYRERRRLTRGVNDQPSSAVCTGQAACRSLRSI